MARSKIHDLYNIEREIVREAEALGLDAIATGGNTDFISKVIGKNEDGSDRLVILTSAEAGGTPDRLTEPSELIVILDMEWHDEIGIPVRTAREGMRLMAVMHDPYAGGS